MHVTRCVERRGVADQDRDFHFEGCEAPSGCSFKDMKGWSKYFGQLKENEAEWPNVEFTLAPVKSINDVSLNCAETNEIVTQMVGSVVSPSWT